MPNLQCKHKSIVTTRGEKQTDNFQERAHNTNDWCLNEFNCNGVDNDGDDGDDDDDNNKNNGRR